jgi:hypothetical protein
VGCRAKCKGCGLELQGLVARMKDHKVKCLNKSEAVNHPCMPDSENLQSTCTSAVESSHHQTNNDSENTQETEESSATLSTSTSSAFCTGSSQSVKVCLLIIS